MGKFNDRTGETRTMNNGLAATIVSYRRSKDMDIQFENGEIVNHRIYHDFKHGLIKCPMLLEYIGNYVKATNPNVTPQFMFLIDAEDVGLLGDRLWCKDSDGYAYGWVSRKLQYLHRVIMNPPDDMEVDHKSGDRADYRRSNLRVCTHAENCRNRPKKPNSTSGYKGVYLDKRTNRWESKININGKCIRLGSFTSKIEAANVYNEAALKYHGEFACQR